MTYQNTPYQSKLYKCVTNLRNKGDGHGIYLFISHSQHDIMSSSIKCALNNSGCQTFAKLVPCSFYPILVNIPVEGIRLLDAVCLLLGTPFAAVWSQPGVVCSEKVTFDPLTPQGQFRGLPTYTHQVWRRSVKGPRRSRGTNKQTNRQTLLDL